MSEKKPFPKLILPWSMIAVGLVIGWQALAEIMDLGAFGTSVASLYAFLGVIALFALAAKARTALLPLACVLFPVAFGLSYGELSGLESKELLVHGYLVLGVSVIALASLVVTSGKLTMTTAGLFAVSLCVSAATVTLVTLDSPNVEIVLAGALVVVGTLVTLLMRRDGGGHVQE